MSLSMQASPAANPLDVVEQIVSANEWSFDRRSDAEMAAEAPGKWCDYGLYFSWSGEISAMHFTCTFDLKVPAPRRAALYELLARANERLWIGHFGMDSDDGMPLFRHSVLLRRGSRRLGREPRGHGRYRDHRMRALLPGVPVRAVGRQGAGRGAGGGHAGMRGRGLSDHRLPSVLLVGAGRMGAAMFAGWSEAGLAPSLLIDPSLPPGVARAEDRLLASIDDLPPDYAADAVVLAVKPQAAATLLPPLGRLVPPGAVVLSILAGLPVARLSALLGGANPIVRAMPNTPAAIGRGMTVAVAGPGVSAAQRELCHRLLAASGEVAWLEDEALVDPATSVSGCGPAYVFLLAELMEQEGVAQGLPPALARQLARATVAGAGALLAASPEEAAQLRRNVTSPNGVTERALAVLMERQAWPDALHRALEAATARSRELAA